MNIGMKSGLFVLCFLVIAGLGVPGCDTITSELDDTEEPVRDNPGDPGGTNAQPPVAEITSHDNSQTSIINGHTLTITWQAGADGVQEGVEFRYKLAAPDENVDDLEWSAWSTVTQLDLAYLDESFEGATYHFRVEARAGTELSQSTPTDFFFIIDAVPDAGLIFHPRRITPVNNVYTTEVWVDGIQSSDFLAGVKAVISFDAAAYQVQSVTVYEDGNSILGNSGGTLAAFTSQTSGTIEFNVGVLGGDLTLIEGSGRIATIQFTASGDGSPAEITLDDTSKLKNVDGGDIAITAFDAAQLSN